MRLIFVSFPHLQDFAKNIFFVFDENIFFLLVCRNVSIGEQVNTGGTGEYRPNR